MAFETLTFYSNPPQNYIGTTIFLSYMVLALVLTTNIIISLYRQHSRVTKTRNENASIRPLVALALLSFATLSYHMLRFLINSWLQWRIARSFFKTDDGSLGLWHWMLQSNLFAQFPQELIREEKGWVWTHMELLEMWGWNMWVAQKAKQRGFGTKEMMAFYGLSQILPISFTVALFLLRLQLDDKTGSAISREKKNAVKPEGSSKIWIPLTVSTLLMNALIVVSPALQHSTYLMPVVGLTRVLLLLPHLGFTGARSQEDWIGSISLSAGFVVVNGSFLLKGYGVDDLLGALWRSGQSVQTLGWDAVIGGIVAAYAWIAGML